MEIALSQATLLAEITLWVPFRTTGRDRDDGEQEPAPGLDDLIQRFKIQAFVDGEWQEVAVASLQGPEPNPASPGWLKTRYHRNKIKFVGVFASKLRFLQDAGGGAPATPGVSTLSEIELRGFGAQPADGCIEYGYDANGNQVRRVEGTVEETFAYDYANRLAAFTRRRTKGPAQPPGKPAKEPRDVSGADSGNPNRPESFVYLFVPTGERVAKRNLKRNQSEFFMYDGQDIVADYSPLKKGGFEVIAVRLTQLLESRAHEWLEAHNEGYRIRRGGERWQRGESRTGESICWGRGRSSTGICRQSCATKCLERSGAQSGSANGRCTRC